MTDIFGATTETWSHFDLVLGLTEDLLPVVSNPNATISPQSKMAALGKTPSKYNNKHQAVGIPDWTQYHATEKDIEGWSSQSDYGICVQTRNVRAIDVDVKDKALAEEIHEALYKFNLPVRKRENSSKFLLAFHLPGELSKRIIKTAHGPIEFLATGQQFVAVGMHPDGVPYSWPGGLPSTIPSLTKETFESLWSDLESRFAVEPATTQRASNRSQILLNTLEADPVAAHLVNGNWVLSKERDGRLHIRCPFEHEHTGASSESSTTYFPANTGGYANGHFVCLHAHCADRGQAEFQDAVGILDDLFLPVATSQEEIQTDTPARFAVQKISEFSSGPPPEWIIKDVLPKAELGVIYGDSGSGKSFFAFDMIAAIATEDVSWRGTRTTHGPCVYIAAEGAGGFRKRTKAYAKHHGMSLADLPIGIISDAPNLMLPVDIKAVIKSVLDFGRPSVIVVDTLAAALPGGDENSGGDMGLALKHCRAIHKHTGAMVLLIHHSGKDSSKGARGWSGLRAAVDCEISVYRDGDARGAKITKQKDGDDTDKTFGFKLEVVRLDDAILDAEEVTSCVCVATDIMPDLEKKKKDPDSKIKDAIKEERKVITEPIPLNNFADLVAERMKNNISSQTAMRVISSLGLVEGDGCVHPEGGDLSVADG